MFLDLQSLQKQIKHFLKPYEYSYDLSVLPLKLCRSGGIKEGDNFSDFSHYFSFSHKLIEHFLRIVGNSLVIMHSNMHSRTQLPITGCFCCTEVHLLQFQMAERG